MLDLLLVYLLKRRGRHFLELLDTKLEVFAHAVATELARIQENTADETPHSEPE